jgi:hypothetical protein
VEDRWRIIAFIKSLDARASEKKIYPKIAPDFGPDTRRFEGGHIEPSPLGATQ